MKIVMRTKLLFLFLVLLLAEARASLMKVEDSRLSCWHYTGVPEPRRREEKIGIFEESRYDAYTDQYYENFYRRYKAFIDVKLEQHIKHSAEREESLSWMFNEGYKKDVYDSNKETFREIRNFGREFYEKFWNAIQRWGEYHQMVDEVTHEDESWMNQEICTILEPHGFKDLSFCQEGYDEGEARQQIFAHPSGFVVRYKPDRKQLSFSIYKNQFCEALRNCIKTPSSNKFRDNLRHLFAIKKGKLECAKLYIAPVVDDFKLRMLVEPIPSQPNATLALRALLGEEGISIIPEKVQLKLGEYMIRRIMKYSHVELGGDTTRGAIYLNTYTLPHSIYQELMDITRENDRWHEQHAYPEDIENMDIDQ